MDFLYLRLRRVRASSFKPTVATWKGVLVRRI